jgi:hypothetical protein
MLIDLMIGARNFKTLRPVFVLPILRPTNWSVRTRPLTINTERMATIHHEYRPGVKDWLTTIPNTPTKTNLAKAIPSVDRSSSSFNLMAASAIAKM